MDVTQNGSDRKPVYVPGIEEILSGFVHEFTVHTAELENDSSTLDALGKEMEALSQEIISLAGALETSISTVGVKAGLLLQSTAVGMQAKSLKNLAKNLRYIKKLYTQTESRIVSSVPK